MIRVESEGLVYYRFEIFEGVKELAHGVFTRAGGVGSPPHDGLNLGFQDGFPEEHTAANLGKAARALGFSDLAFAGQVHGDQAMLVRSEDNYRPRRAADVVPGFDALMTPDPGVGLLVKLADCQGVLLYDPVSKNLAVVHSGWRGSVQNILGKTARRMKDELGARPENMLAGISPSLGPCCAEFVNFRDELPREFWDYGRGSLFDFWAISRDQLVDAGLRPENVEYSNMCTKCGSEGFFSYRGEGRTGRFGLAAGRIGD
ncbi:MAG: polyphenol oxidase family protein [Pseudomonadota bacterium]